MEIHRIHAWNISLPNFEIQELDTLVLEQKVIKEKKLKIFQIIINWEGYMDTLMEKFSKTLIQYLLNHY